MSAVSIEAAKIHLRITNDDDDDLIAQKIRAAEDHVAAFIGGPVASIPVIDAEGEFVMTVPPGVREAVLQQVANLYDGTPVDLGGLLAPYREWAF